MIQPVSPRDFLRVALQRFTGAEGLIIKEELETPKKLISAVREGHRDRTVELGCWADMTERGGETYGRQATTSADD